MTRSVSFNVVGMPAGQGSKRAFVVAGKARMTESAGTKWSTWRDAVATAAKREADRLDGPLDGALSLYVAFRFQMPKSRPKQVRERGVAPKTTAPDLSKLVRAVEDACQAAGLITDDARIWTIQTAKEEHLRWTGAEIYIREES